MSAFLEMCRVKKSLVSMECSDLIYTPAPLGRPRKKKFQIRRPMSIFVFQKKRSEGRCAYQSFMRC